MFKQLIPRASARASLRTFNQSSTQSYRFAPSTSLLQDRIAQRRGYATPAGAYKCIVHSESHFADTDAEEKDLIIIGGGVAGYVAAIKAGQEGLKVRIPLPIRRRMT